MMLACNGAQGVAIRDLRFWATQTTRPTRSGAQRYWIPPSPGRPFEADEQTRMLAVARSSTLAAREACLRRARGEHAPRGAKQGGSPCIYPALVIALNCGMRDSEIRLLTWDQIDFEKRFLTVGQSKTAAGTGRTIPLNDALLDVMTEHARWYIERFGETRPEWFVFPGGGRFPSNPAVAIGTLKTAWTMVRTKAGVKGRWHDNRHTLITELAESGAGDETIMEIAGHVSRQMLSRYSHIRMQAKREALEEVGRRRAAEGAARKQSHAQAHTTARCHSGQRRTNAAGPVGGSDHCSAKRRPDSAPSEGREKIALVTHQKSRPKSPTHSTIDRNGLTNASTSSSIEGLGAAVVATPQSKQHVEGRTPIRRCRRAVMHTVRWKRPHEGAIPAVRRARVGVEPRFQVAFTLRNGNAIVRQRSPGDGSQEANPTSPECRDKRRELRLKRFGVRRYGRDITEDTNQLEDGHPGCSRRIIRGKDGSIWNFDELPGEPATLVEGRYRQWSGNANTGHRDDGQFRRYHAT